MYDYACEDMCVYMHIYISVYRCIYVYAYIYIFFSFLTMNKQETTEISFAVVSQINI